MLLRERSELQILIFILFSVQLSLVNFTHDTGLTLHSMLVYLVTTLQTSSNPFTHDPNHSDGGIVGLPDLLLQWHMFVLTNFHKIKKMEYRDCWHKNWTQFAHVINHLQQHIFISLMLSNPFINSTDPTDFSVFSQLVWLGTSQFST